MHNVAAIWRAGPHGPLAHVKPWDELWASRVWVLLGDLVSVQGVPSHVGVQGNERADQLAEGGSCRPPCNRCEQIPWYVTFGTIWDRRKRLNITVTAPPARPPALPTVVRMPACHSRRFKGERPIGAATG